MRVLVFYAGLLLKEVETGDYPFASYPLSGLPDGAYYRLERPFMGYQWYMGDHTPLADEHVPKELLTLALLLT